MKKKILAMLMAGVMVLGLAACGGGDDSTGGETGGETASLSMATGGTSGTYYGFSGVLAQVLNEKVEGMNITVQATGASKANIDQSTPTPTSLPSFRTT